MTLTQKETSLLKDLKSQEQLCYEKYSKYSEMAKASELKALFKDISTAEKAHYDTVCSILNGTVPNVSENLSANNDCCKAVSYSSESDRDHDKFLLSDMLAMEKHVSGLYDTTVFEFCDPNARKMLNHIQSEEQQHGEQLFAYMSNNKMYSV